MTWERLTADEPELYYASEATEAKQIARDFGLVFERMLERRAEDDAEGREQLLVMPDEINGHLKVVWYDHVAGKPAGTWVYQLRLKPLWELSVDDPRGVARFEEVCHRALCEFMEATIYDERGDQTFEVYVRSSAGTIAELIL